MQRSRVTALAAILVLAAPALTHAITMRCAGGLVSAGDTEDAVLEKCGQPDSVDRFVWTYERAGSLPMLVTFELGKVSFVDTGKPADFAKPSSIDNRP